MNRKNLLLLIVIVIGIITAALFLWRSPSNHNKPTGSGTSTSNGTPPATAVIEITPAGFNPKTLAVSTNTNIIWVNEDVMPHLPAADPYPSHSSLPYLVAPRALGVKETYSFLVTKSETINYHDDLHPVLTGTIEVK